METIGYGAPTGQLDAVFAALADPTRRAILSRLAEGEASVNELAAPFEISQPAISKHLKVLERAGLIERNVDRQRRPARLTAEPMAAAVRWLEEFKRFWASSFDQLDELLDDLKKTSLKGEKKMSDLPTYVLERTFDAPRDLVWRTWTEPALLSRWYGPNVETIIHRLDVKPGGLWLNEMKMGDKTSYQRTEYIEVVEPERLVCLMSNADSDWKIAPNPMMADWPRTLLTTVMFDEVNGRTAMRLTWEPHEASEAEIGCFAGAIAGMDKGWAAGMELLAELLAELQA
jgi:uncharacterized protein YndB with AHSA1/START domain